MFRILRNADSAMEKALRDVGCSPRVFQFKNNYNYIIQHQRHYIQYNINWNIEYWDFGFMGSGGLYKQH